MSAPPGLQDPFLWLFCEDRATVGNVLGNLKGWLGVWSLRTLEVSGVRCESENVVKLVSRLHRALKGTALPRTASESEEFVIQAVVDKIHDASLQNETCSLKKNDERFMGL
ncbi:cystathionine gamma-synthase [Paracoccidioides lutzii Pb01]|uniref:Cystathionine gamma-synthase n=1 Tax=Paracoccidioides lutzii (strain ATCC MYA-826 / Pb01) TaxID=502779 RepID=C1H1H5_PARBA|nr:cystathionine gamma-synthase [Paracoccidioides lutzii Pb01]EEH33569.2 cystathionine gamma-synthase [Paracoccidioides lutzii Pb01]